MSSGPSSAFSLEILCYGLLTLSGTMTLSWFSTVSMKFLDYLASWIDSLVPYYTALIIFYVCSEIVFIKDSSQSSAPITISPSVKPIETKTKAKNSNINLDFNGTYKLMKNINTQALLEAQGMGFFRRKLVDAADVIQGITIAPNFDNLPNETTSNLGIIAFYIHASVRGKGEVTKNVSYPIDDIKGTQRMVQKETGIVFLDHISFLDDGTMKMVRTEENHQFQIIVYSTLETSRLDGHVTMISESIFTSKHGNVIKSKRIFQKVNQSGQHLTNLEVSKSTLRNESKETSTPQNFSSPAEEDEQQQLLLSPPPLPAGDEESIFSPIVEGTYVTINPYSFMSQIEASSNLSTSLQHSEQKLHITIEENILTIKTPNQVSVSVDMNQTNAASITPTQTTLGSFVFESIAIRTPNKRGEIVVKRRCTNHSEREINDNMTDEVTSEEQVLNEIYETYQWAENRQRLMVKTIFYFSSERKIESVQMMQRII